MVSIVKRFMFLLGSYNSISVTIINPTNDRKWLVVSYVVIRPELHIYVYDNGLF